MEKLLMNTQERQKIAEYNRFRASLSMGLLINIIYLNDIDQFSI
jgi:hypothetical protein